MFGFAPSKVVADTSVDYLVTNFELVFIGVALCHC